MSEKTLISKDEFADWLVSQEAVKIENYTKDGVKKGQHGWRYHFRKVGYGLKCVDERGEIFHILNDRMLECWRKENQVWAVHMKRVLLYTAS